MNTLNNPYETPRVTMGRAASGDLKWLLFSFDGRIPRRSYWGGALGSGVVMYIGLFTLMFLFGPDDGAEPGGLFFVLLMAFYVPFLWINLALTVKRWHDRGKSGFWMFIALIPLVGPLWSFIETGCLRGDIGPNEYGEDPT